VKKTSQHHHSESSPASTVSEVENNKFTVYGENGKFNWLVHALRGEVNVEPDKDIVNVKGEGPYLWI
jgi:hypothetical protein